MPEERKDGYYTTYYAKKQQMGLCIKCDQKAANGRYCSECFKKMSVHTKKGSLVYKRMIG